MKTTISILAFIFISVSLLNAQETSVVHSEYFSGPEAIIHDSELNVYFIGNATDGRVLRMDSLGVVMPFIESLGANMVMSFEIIGDSLYASTNYPSTITCINKYTGDIFYQLNMDAEVQSFAQTVVDPRNSDMYIMVQQGAVYKFVPSKALIWKFADEGVGSGSQAVEIDTTNNRLMCFSWGSPYVKYIDIGDSTDVTSGLSTGSFQYTASTTGPDGYIYLSSWSNHHIQKFKRDSVMDHENFCADSLYQPVGITYNSMKNEFAVCNYGNNTITLISVESVDTVGIENNNLRNEKVKIYNPVNSKNIVIKCCDAEYKISSVLIYNSVGQVVKRVDDSAVLLNQSLIIDGSNLIAGFYIVTVIDENQIIGSAKLVLN